MEKPGLPLHRLLDVRASSVLLGVVLLFVLARSHGPVFRQASKFADDSRIARAGAGGLSDAAGPAPALSWHDSLDDGFPDSARLDSAQDRLNFTRWFTFLAETQYYTGPRGARSEITDCAALVRFAYRNSLIAHSAAWRHDTELPYDPGFADITKYHYPHGPLRQALFRAIPGPFAAGDFAHGAFVEFADGATLLHYNTYPISRDVRAAEPGDLLFFHQAVQREPFHSMLFVGKSYYQPQHSDWIVYHTGDIDGHRGEIREVRVETLLAHPDLHWRPLLANPNFLGVYRLELLR